MTKKNNTTEKNLLEAQRFAEALKEGTKKTLNSLLNEAISEFIDKEDDDEEETDKAHEKTNSEDTIQDDSYSVEDVPTKDEDDSEDEKEKEESSSEKEEDDEDEWSDEELKKFEVGDKEYDLTNVDDDTAFSIFSKVGDSDLVHIQKQSDGTYEINDENSGAELVLDLDPDGKKDGDETKDDDTEEDSEFEVVIDDEDEKSEDEADETEDEESEDEIEVDLGDIEDEDKADTEDDDEEKEDLDEDLGYTDDYQKDVFAQKFDMTEPAKKEATFSVDGGVPTGSEKPWAGKHENPDYSEVDIELDEMCKDGEDCEADLEESGASRTSVKKSHMVKGDKEKPEGFPARGPQANLSEGQVKKIIALSKTILAENKKYKEAIGKIKQGLQEAYVTNTNYGRLVNILMTETTTKEEKRNIVERFKDVKTIQEGKILSESIRKELNSSKKNTSIKLDEQISANSSKTINETVMFENTAENNPIISLMERMDKLAEFNGNSKKHKK